VRSTSCYFRPRLLDTIIRTPFPERGHGASALFCAAHETTFSTGRDDPAFDFASRAPLGYRSSVSVLNARPGHGHAPLPPPLDDRVFIILRCVVSPINCSCCLPYLLDIFYQFLIAITRKQRVK